MPKVFNFTGGGDFSCGWLQNTNPKESSVISVDNHLVDVFFPLRKRSRISAPYVVHRESKKQQPSIEVLPDECLFEVLRRLPTGAEERSACACVSKRWLMLLSTLRRDEICTIQVAQPVKIETCSIPKIQEESTDPEDSIDFRFNRIKSEVEEFCQGTTNPHGHLSRSLEGKKATDVRLAAIAVGTASCGGLGKLSIRGTGATTGLTNLGLKAISRGCPSLRVLSLWNLSSIGDEGLCEVAVRIHSLEKIHFSHCPAITDKCLIAIAQSCPNLISVTIESCANIGNDSLKALGQYCLNLKCLTVQNCPLVGDQGVASLFSFAGQVLTKVKFQGLNITDVSLALIGHYGKTITDLSLVRLGNVNERGFWVMGKGQGLQQLKSLHISACGGISDLGLEALGKGCPDLKLLSLRKCQNIFDNGVVVFAKAAGSLGSLQLEECHMITQLGLFGILANCNEKLKALAVSSCLGMRDVDSGMPVVISSCSSLRSLNIHDCPGFGDYGLALLGKLCAKLTHVGLGGLHGITDTGVLPLVQKSEDGLVNINLSGCVNLTDSIVAAITKLHGETIELLNLDGCKYLTDLSLMAIARNCSVLRELDISQSIITDSGIAALASNDQFNLQILSLGGCSLVSDKMFSSLEILGKTLVGLNIQNCRGISFNTVGLLIKQLWRCDILS